MSFLLICKSKNKTVVEYALNSIENPIGVSEYQLTTKLPNSFKSTLPSIEEIEAKLGDKNVFDEETLGTDEKPSESLFL